MNTEAKKIALPVRVYLRRTIDGIDVLVWSDGALSDRLGYLVAGRLPAALRTIAADEICTLNWDELPRLVLAAKKVRGEDVHALRTSLRRGLPRAPLTEEERVSILESESTRRLARTREHLTFCRGAHCKVCSGKPT